MAKMYKFCLQNSIKSKFSQRPQTPRWILFPLIKLARLVLFWRLRPCIYMAVFNIPKRCCYTMEGATIVMWLKGYDNEPRPVPGKNNEILSIKKFSHEDLGRSVYKLVTNKSFVKYRFCCDSLWLDWVSKKPPVKADLAIQWNLLIRTLENVDTCIIHTPSCGPK